MKNLMQFLTKLTFIFLFSMEVFAEIPPQPGQSTPCQEPDPYTDCENEPWSLPVISEFSFGGCVYRYEYYFKACKNGTPRISITNIWCITEGECFRTNDKMIIKAASIKILNDNINKFDFAEAFAIVGMANCEKLNPNRPDPYVLNLPPTVVPKVNNNNENINTVENSVIVYDYIQFCPSECCFGYYIIGWNENLSEIVDLENDFVRIPADGTQCYFPCTSNCENRMTFGKPQEYGYHVNGYGAIYQTNNTIEASIHKDYLNENIKLSLYDFNGYLLISKSSIGNDKVFVELDNNIPTGTYYAVLTYNDKFICSKAIVLVK